jgi:hypothetical protein
MKLGGLFACRHRKLFLVSAQFIALMIAGITLPRAQPSDSSCSAVMNAIARLRQQSWVHVRGQVTQGVHPEGYTRMESILLGGHQQVRILDGTG